MNFPKPRPSYPIAAKLLIVVVIVALVGLGLVAYEVFRMIDSPVVAGAFAIVIELGAISEAISVMRRNRPAIAGLVISLAVSGIYNFTRGAQAAAGLAIPLSALELTAISVGPLSATLFLSLALGHEDRTYQARVARWEQEREAWHQAQIQAEQASAERVQLAQLAAQERAAKRAERVQLAQARTQPAPAAVQPAPVTVQPAQGRGTFAQFEADTRTRNGAGPMKPREIQETYNVSRRTSYDWLKKLGT